MEVSFSLGIQQESIGFHGFVRAKEPKHVLKASKSNICNTTEIPTFPDKDSAAIMPVISQLVKISGLDNHGASPI